MVRVSLQTVALDVPPQDVITRDNVSLKVSAVIYFRVVDPVRAVVAVQDYLYATSTDCANSPAEVLGQVELDDLLSARDKINQQLQRIIDEHTEPWGIKVANVEVKQIDLPQDMQRAMAKQAEAERERRAKSSTPRASSRRRQARRAAEVLTRFRWRAAALSADDARDRLRANTTTFLFRSRWTCSVRSSHRAARTAATPSDTRVGAPAAIACKIRGFDAGG